MKSIYCLLIPFYRLSKYKKLYVVNLIFSILSCLLKIAFIKIFSYNIQLAEYLDLITYSIATVFLSSVVSLYRIPEFSECFADGTFVKYSIRPFSYFSQLFYGEFGESLVNLIAFFPLLLISIIHMAFYNINYTNIIEFFITFLLSIVLSILVINNFYSLTVITTKNNAPRALLQGIASLVSGSLLPLYIFPEGIQKVFYLMPFAYIIGSPIQILLGKAELLNVLKNQLFWIVVLLFINICITEKIYAKLNNY